jgi:hypothetical protein
MIVDIKLHELESMRIFVSLIFFQSYISNTIGLHKLVTEFDT